MLPKIELAKKRERERREIAQNQMDTKQTNRNIISVHKINARAGAAKLMVLFSLFWNGCVYCPEQTANGISKECNRKLSD